MVTWVGLVPSFSQSSFVALGVGVVVALAALWRRRSVVEGKSGALDLPGATWRDRPAIRRGGDVFLAGDMVAAPGLLSEVSFNSALEASVLALRAYSGGLRSMPARASTGRRVSAATR